MAVQSIERVFTSFHTIVQYLAETGFIEPSHQISWHKIIGSRLSLTVIVEQVVTRLPIDYPISIDSSLSALANAFPQKLITIAYLRLQQLRDMCEQIQKSRTKENYLCRVDRTGTGQQYWHNLS